MPERGPTDVGEAPLNLFQRAALRRLRRAAGRTGAEPLQPADWEAVWRLDHTMANRALHGLWHVLPGPPRCRICTAPFGGVGRFIARRFGCRPSRKNPQICATCVELSPPGGTTMCTGVLFADIRGFTALSEGTDPEAVSRQLRRFYGCAEATLLPEAIIDKLIGDEVMALYLEPILPDGSLRPLMVRHARELLAAVGYGTEDGPFVEIGVGIDVGDAFVGNIGQRDVFDFTAVGDVVNTASRLQGSARGGEILVSARAGEGVELAGAEPVDIPLKGKQRPIAAHRICLG